jgi:hypothetical protein
MRILFFFVLCGLVTIPFKLFANLVPDQAGVIEIINSERSRAGISALVVNEKLSFAAQDKANELANTGVIVHSSAPKNTPWKVIADRGYLYKLAGENLAIGFTSSPDVVTDWMRSPTHKANVLNLSYKDVGIGTAVGIINGKKVSYTVALFADPKDVIATKPSDKTIIISEVETSNRERELLGLISALQSLLKQLQALRV